MYAPKNQRLTSLTIREKLLIFNSLSKPGAPQLRVWKKSAQELDWMIEARALGLPRDAITRAHTVGELVHILTGFPHLRDSTIIDVVRMRWPRVRLDVAGVGQIRGL